MLKPTHLLLCWTQKNFDVLSHPGNKPLLDQSKVENRGSVLIPYAFRYQVVPHKYQIDSGADLITVKCLHLAKGYQVMKTSGDGGIL